METNELPKTLDHVEVFSPPEPDSCRYRRSTGCTARTNVLSRNMHVLLKKWMRGCRAGTLYKRRQLWWRRPARCTRGGRSGGGDQSGVPEEASSGSRPVSLVEEKTYCSYGIANSQQQEADGERDYSSSCSGPVPA
jgi:hypothetical protein